MIYQRQPETTPIPIHIIHLTQLNDWIAHQPATYQQWLKSVHLERKEGQVVPLPNETGSVAGYAFLLKSVPDQAWLVGDLPVQLPAGTYCLEMSASGYATDHAWCELAYLAWGLGQYRFNRYRSTTQSEVICYLAVSHLSATEVDQLNHWYQTIHWVRDLINTPCEDMGPDALAAEAGQLAMTFGGTCQVTLGDDLLSQGYPAVHWVGRAGARLPRLIDCRWPAPAQAQRRLTLVGKGVCFDTGGLDLKPPMGMRWMKKDMGGAAHALGLARMILQTGLPIELRVLIPAVENNIDAHSYRPGDILTTRAGLSVEVSNTDAEGRLILADALTSAAETKPDCIIDFATLTGAARVALGPDVVALFSNRHEIARAIMEQGEGCGDPIWPLPLYQPYQPMLESSVADLLNAPSGRFGGAITAALFLQRFVQQEIPWVHLDLYASNDKPRGGRPVGGEAMGLRAVYRWLADAF